MVSRYHPLFVTLHWLMALLVIATLLTAKLGLDPTPNSDPDKVSMLRIHMIVGLFLGTLLVIRLITRYTTARPPAADTERVWMNRARKTVHFLLYFLLFSQVITGIVLALVPDLYPAGTNLFTIVFGGANQALPESFNGHPVRSGHGLYSTLLLVFILLHLGAALYHQFRIKDNLIGRMWFGRRR
ncbi:cytochrome b [Saccharospirillum salsuginis]|uniref:Branched-chain alpha-keto acid dehydrogenase subunit E2 n=1 Tax=Saccharospirillum salsuginis TaxID=418750 RepID=A0A918KDR2_9GAMM|nr:cytochrome b/b6 domain-containing protein [Saccharospirillum salsuginis]GGX57736.1 branched-chain alpha-keto acid dehydrogenase subunit E2 [Saccharospirillum salsuginis]